MKKSKLTKLKIREISGVDKGANPGAHVLFFKHEGENGMTPEEILKKQEELEAQNADLQAANKKLEEDLAKAKKTPAADAEDKLDGGVDENMEDAQGKLKKAETVSKSDFEAIEKANKDLAEKVAKMEADKAFDEFSKGAIDRVPTLKANDALLKSLHSMEKDAREEVLKSLESAEKVKEEYMVTKGHNIAMPDSAEAKLDALAKKHADEHKVDFAKAYSAVCDTEEGKKLYEQTLPN